MARMATSTNRILGSWRLIRRREVRMKHNVKKRTTLEGKGHGKI